MLYDDVPFFDIIDSLHNYNTKPRRRVSPPATKKVNVEDDVTNVDAEDAFAAALSEELDEASLLFSYGKPATQKN